LAYFPDNCRFQSFFRFVESRNETVHPLPEFFIVRKKDSVSIICNDDNNSRANSRELLLTANRADPLRLCTDIAVFSAARSAEPGRMPPLGNMAGADKAASLITRSAEQGKNTADRDAPPGRGQDSSRRNRNSAYQRRRFVNRRHIKNVQAVFVKIFG
jgi:hypothetical protein